MKNMKKLNKSLYTLHTTNIVTNGHNHTEWEAYRGCWILSNSEGSWIQLPGNRGDLKLRGQFVIFTTAQEAHEFIDAHTSADQLRTLN